jgi:tetratricopeptide (TPR) repeat protein
MTLKLTMRSLVCVLFLAASLGLWGQSSGSSNSGSSNSGSSNSNSSNSQPQNPIASKQSSSPIPNLAPPRSDRVNADSLPDDGGSSSSKNTQIDLSPPPDDDKAHPKSSDILMDEENAPGNADVNEMHLWDPHKSAKDIEVGDYYFNRKNYVAAESRYREALYYKNNDALATYRLAVCLEKLDRPDEAREQYENYLKILPHGPQAEGAKKEIERLTKPASAAAKVAK